MSSALENGVNAFIEQIDRPVASFFNSCVHCGMCSEACLFYTETGDPKYTPIHKLEPMRRVWKRNFTFWGKLGAMLGLIKPVTDEELEEWEPLIYDSCTMCGRCSMVCPVGNDITYMIRKAREGMVAAGHAPRGLKDATIRAVDIGSPMGVTWKTVQATIKHTQEDTGLPIPVDKQGADYMVIMSSMEIVNFPEYLGAISRIFDQADISWTLCSEATEATNSGIQIGSSDIAAQIVQRVVDGAEKLGVKYVISPECGHAYTAIRWEGPNLIGRPYPFKVIHILELLDELREQGKLRTEGMETARMSFHDPCQLVRHGGLTEQPRRLLKMVAGNYVDMPDPGVWNWCCGGGGGVSANDRADPLLLRVFSRKKSQLDDAQVETLVTACANCRIVLEGGLEHYQMPIPVVGLTETLAKHLVPAPQSSANAGTESGG